MAWQLPKAGSGCRADTFSLSTSILDQRGRIFPETSWWTSPLSHWPKVGNMATCNMIRETGLLCLVWTTNDSGWGHLPWDQGLLAWRSDTIRVPLSGKTWRWEGHWAGIQQYLAWACFLVNKWASGLGPTLGEMEEEALTAVKRQNKIKSHSITKIHKKTTSIAQSTQAPSSSLTLHSPWHYF